jgi:hypothetical protein
MVTFLVLTAVGGWLAFLAMGIAYLILSEERDTISGMYYEAMERHWTYKQANESAHKRNKVRVIGRVND